MKTGTYSLQGLWEDGLSDFGETKDWSISVYNEVLISKSHYWPLESDSEDEENIIYGSFMAT